MVPQASQLAVLDVLGTVSASSGCPAHSAGRAWCPGPLCVFMLQQAAEGVTHELLPIPPLPLACCGYEVLLFIGQNILLRQGMQSRNK